MAGSSSSGNQSKPVDWSYDSVSDAPNFLSFENDTSSSVGRGSFSGRRSRPWRPYNRGHRGGYPEFRGPPVGRYEHRPPRRAPFPYRQPFPPHQPHHYGPPEPFRGRRFNNNWSHGRGNSHGRGGRYGGRSRGGFNHGAQGGADVPISAYFHPSMLEDPWAPATSVKNAAVAEENSRKAVDVVVPKDDPELLELCAQMKGDADAIAAIVDESSDKPPTTPDGPMEQTNAEDTVMVASLAEDSAPDTTTGDKAIDEA